MRWDGYKMIPKAIEGRIYVNLFLFLFPLSFSSSFFFSFESERAVLFFLFLFLFEPFESPFLDLFSFCTSLTRKTKRERKEPGLLNNHHAGLKEDESPNS